MIKKENLPKGWKNVILKDVLNSLENGNRPKGGIKDINEGIPSLGGEHLNSSGGFKFNNVKRVTHEFYNSLKRGKIKKGDVLVVKDGATTGKTSFVDSGFPFEEAAVNEHVFILRGKKEFIDQKFLFYHLFSPLGQLQIDSNFRGATIGGINTQFVKNYKLTLPPLKTQQKIVEILEKAEKLKEWRAEADVLINEYLKSVFLEMFGDPVKNPKSWPLKKFKDLMVGTPQNGLYKNSSYYTKGEDGVPILRIDSFYDGKIENIQNLKRIICTDDEINRFKLKNQNIVINRVNSIEYLGKCALVEGLLEETVYESNVMQIELNLSLINPIYLTKLLCTTYVHNQIRNKAKKAVNQASINQKDVNSLSIMVPPLELQNQFAQTVKKVEQIKTHQKQSKQQINNLFNNLMQKAFKGELTC